MAVNLSPTGPIMTTGTALITRTKGTGTGTGKAVVKVTVDPRAKQPTTLARCSLPKTSSG